MVDSDDIDGPGDDGLDHVRGAIERSQAIEPDEGEAGPEGCPVIPLGTNDGQYFYLTPLRQIARVRAKDHGPLGIIGLFEGKVAWLWEKFPVKRGGGQDGEEKVVGWHHQRAATWLMDQCRERGVVDVSVQIRGLGAWPDPVDPRSLVFHAGDAVLIGGQPQRAGMHDGYIYTASRPIDRPGDTPLTPAEAARLLVILETWNWRYEEIMPRLLLGWLAVAGVPAALGWRPSIWLSGDAETGKSTLIVLIRMLLAKTVHHLANISEAGLRQTLRMDALSAMVDEFETDGLGEIVDQVLTLVRVASSDISGSLVRGSGDGMAAFSRITACFLFSSIVVPPLSTANQDRLTLFDLQPLDKSFEDREAFRREFDAVAAFGPKLRRRVLDNWHRFRGCLDAYGAALARAGHRNRAADQLGTLLAGADLLLTDEVTTPERAEEYAALLPAERLAEDADRMPTHTRWLLDLITQPAGNWHSGVRLPIGQMIANCNRLGGDEQSSAELRALGLRVVPATEAEQRWRLKEPGLLVANRHMQLKRLFDGTEWAGLDWKLLLRRVPGAISAGKVNFGKQLQTRATLVPLSEVPIDAAPGAAQEVGDF